MNKKSKKTRIAIILGVILALIMSSMSISYASSGTKTMTVYREVIVKGNYAYCSAHDGAYKVNLTTGSKRRLVKTPVYDYGPGNMKIHKGYLYYTSSSGINDPLYRVKLDGTNKRRVGSVVAGGCYAISNGKIYYEYYDGNKDKTINKVMKLNGKNKKKSSYKAKNIYRNSNKSNYRVKEKETNSGKIVCYLVKPSGKTIKLCTYEE